MANYAGMPLGYSNTPVPIQPQQVNALDRLKGMWNNPDLAMALLANSGYSPHKRSFGEVLGTSMMQANQMKQGREDDAFKRKYMEAQMAAMQNPANRSPYGSIPVERVTPESLKRFEASGKYSDLEFKPEQKQMMDTAEMRNYNFRASLPDDAARRQFDDIIRQQYSFGEVGGGPTQRRTGPTPTLTPLSTLPGEISAISQKKEAESQAGAIGAGRGGVIADIQKKGANAKSIMGVLDLADPLIDTATGSLVGAGADKVASAFGKSLSGAEATAQLQVLQAGLMLNQPRMEGPQSDADVKLYQAAAGQIGDPTVPAPIKKAAVRTIRALQEKYMDRAAAVSSSTAADPLGIR